MLTMNMLHVTCYIALFMLCVMHYVVGGVCCVLCDLRSIHVVYVYLYMHMYIYV